MSLEALFDEAPCGLAMADAEGRLTLINRALVEQSGRPREALLGRRLASLFTVAGQMYFETHLLPMLQLQGFVREIALELRRPDGERRPVLFNAAIQRDGEGRLASTTYTLLDARERRAFEQELLAARKRAEEAAAARGAFISLLSHEVRTPLQAMLSISELVGAADDEAERRRAVEVVSASASHLLALVNDLLDYGKAEAGKQTLESLPFELRGAVHDVLALLQVNAGKKGIALRAEIDAQLPRRVKGDAVKLRQILTNLVGNALKFTEQGSVTVQLCAGEAGRLAFAVQDTGPGIAPEHLPRLFEAFTQAGDDTSRRFGGTGLGLSICRQLVELHGAKLEVESRLGQGTRFHFELRLEPVEDEVSAPEPLATLPRVPGLVLVAEDDPITALVLQRRLEAWRVPHRLVRDGAAAVQAVSGGGVGVVLLDLQLPVLDGLGALRAIRALPGGAGRTRVVAFSASVDEHERRALEAAGFDACLQKPLDEAALVRALASLFP